MSSWEIAVTVKRHVVTVKGEVLLRLYGQSDENAALAYYFDDVDGCLEASIHEGEEYAGIEVVEEGW